MAGHSSVWADRVNWDTGWGCRTELAGIESGRAEPREDSDKVRGMLVRALAAEDTLPDIGWDIEMVARAAHTAEDRHPVNLHLPVCPATSSVRILANV